MKNNFFNNLSDNKLLSGALTALLASTLLLVVITYTRTTTPQPSAENNQNKEASVDPFLTMDVEAEGVYVYDVANKKPLYTKNKDKYLPLASITKLMTALTAVKTVPDYTVVEINLEHLGQEGDAGLFSNERWKIGVLSNFALIKSSNDAANAIASVAGAVLNQDASDVINEKTPVESFVEVMNITAKEVGMDNTLYFNESGLDIDEDHPGAIGSAQDVSTLMAYIIKEHPSVLDVTRHKKRNFTSLNGISHLASNTNHGVTDIPGIMASKTGYTDIAGGNLVVAFDPYIGRPIIVVVLGSSYEGRFDDVHKLVKASMKYINNEK